MRPIAAVVYFMTALAPSVSQGWGAYGHEQVSDAAVTLLEEGRVPGQLAPWLSTNRTTLQRLAITPDCEWKANRGCKVPEDEKLAALAYQADRFEHPLHFFEPDAFIRNGEVTTSSAATLPNGIYLSIFRDYIQLLARNIDYVLQFPRKKPIADPSQPTAQDVAQNGTAPWRVRQLFDLAVRAFVDNETERAIIYLGTLSHYVGDMSQPFHGTMNYDGQVGTPSAKGIHSTFESKILDRVARQAKAKKDKETKLWSHFHATEVPVLEAARAHLQRRGSLIAAEAIVGETIRTASDGFPHIATLMGVFSSVVEAESSVTAAEQQEFLEARVPGVGITVLALAEERLGASAALLARLWESAWAEAKRRGGSAQPPSGKIEFDVAAVLENYPVPQYLPKDAQQAGQGEHEDHTEDEA